MTEHVAPCDCIGKWVEPGGDHYRYCRGYAMTKAEEIVWRTAPLDILDDVKKAMAKLEQ